MNERPVLDSEERVFTLSDVRVLFRAHFQKLILIALVAGLGSFFFCALRSPKYKVEATFKESVEKSGEGNGLRELLGGMTGASQQPQAVILMQSFQVLKPLVEKMGLQVSVAQPRWIFLKVLNRLKESILAEKGQFLVDLDPFVFEDVSYEGEHSLQLAVRFEDESRFSLFAPGQKKELTKGVVGSPVDLSQCRFTLKKTPKNLKFGKVYSLTVSPWIGVASRLKSNLKIVADKANKSIYNLSFFSRDRRQAVHLLNELMAQYQCYLKKDHDQMATQQLAYLEQRQNHLYGKLAGLFDDHAAYLSKNIEEKGFIGLEEEGASFLAPHQDMVSQLLAIDLELTTLNHNQDAACPTLSSSQNGYFAQELHEISQTIQNLRQQRDLFELSLPQSSLCENQLEARSDELREIRAKRFELESLAQEIQQGKELACLDLSRSLSLGASQLESFERREQLAQYLEKSSHLLSVKEKLLQESFIYQGKKTSELEGIDLPTARTLFINYNLKLDETARAISHYTQLKPALQRPGFEIGSLYSTLTDPFCKKLIEEASNLNKLLKDEKNRSAKEGERWRDELSFLRNILSDHLDQLIAVEQLNASLIREKMVDLQQVSLDCIYRQISVLQERASDAVKEQKQILTQKKQILQNKMAEMRLSAADLPEKWRMEKWLELKTQLGLKMMEGLTQLVEGKTIGHHLHQVESKPLDLATLPLTPQKPNLFLMAFLGAFSASFGTFFVILLKTILKGFPSSFEKLKALRFPLLGTITSHCDGPATGVVTGPDLDLLRRLSLFAKGEKVIGLIGGKGPDYSYALGENLGRMALKTLVLRCDFLAPFREEDLPGIVQLWEGNISALPIRKGAGFDFVTAGGYSPFGSEIIQSSRFKESLEKVKKEYDLIFLLFRSNLSDAETLAALSICEKAVVTVSGETTDQLTPFIDWAYHKGTCRLTFVMQE